MPEPTSAIRPYRAGDGEGLRALWSAEDFRLIADDEAGLDAFAVRNPGLVEDGLRGVGCPRALVIVEQGNDEGLAFWHAQGYEPRDTVQLGKRL
jgi:hypothetical protein